MNNIVSKGLQSFRDTLKLKQIILIIYKILLTLQSYCVAQPTTKTEKKCYKILKTTKAKSIEQLLYTPLSTKIMHVKNKYSD